jgi:hypothetical protein
MVNNPLTEDCITLLRKICPIRRLLHIGDTGKLTLSRYAEWAAKNVTFVLPDESQYLALSPLIEPHPGWSGLHAVVAENVMERDYFKASNPRESGLLAPESLAGIWRNIKTNSRHRVLATTLDVLFQAPPTDGHTANWLVVNCLPALSVIQGASSSLEEVDVIVARVVLDESIAADPSITLAALDDDLVGRGFRRVSVQEERHHALGSAIYVRDWQALNAEYKDILKKERASAVQEADASTRTIERLQLSIFETETAHANFRSLIEDLTSNRDEQIRLANQRYEEREQAVREGGNQARQAEERLEQVNQMIAERERFAQDLTAQRGLATDLDSRIAQITADRDELTGLVDRTQKEREQALLERDAQFRLARDLQIQIEQGSRAVEQDARKLLDAAEKAAAMGTDLLEAQALLEQLSATLKERNARIKELEEERDDLQSRQLQLDREILKAEAQIDLIKDVVLRDKAF